jgi:hypothetical protein
MLRSRSTRTLLPSLLAGLVFACGGKEAANDDAASDPAVEETQSDTDTAQAEAAAPAEPVNTTSAPIAVEDIDRWSKGLEGELKAVKDAGAKLKEAKTSEDTLNAMMGAQEMNTVEAGATAAGLELERYRFVRSNLSSAAGYLAPEIGGVDPSTMPAEMREELKKGNETQLAQMADAVPAEVVAALKPRAAEMRKRDLELAGERLKAVGAGR